RLNNGLDAFGIVAKFFSQSLNMGIYSPRFALVVVTPALNQKLLTAHDKVFILHQAAKESKLLRRQKDFLASSISSACSQLQSDPADLHPVTGKDTALITLDERHSFCIKDRHGEWLRHIIICTEFITQQFVLLVGKGCEENDRNIVCSAHSTADRKPIKLRHHNVKQNCVKFIFINQ